MQKMTTNEFRKYKNMPPLKIEGQTWPDECPMNALAVQLYTSGQQMAMQAQQAAQQPQGAPGQEGDEQPPEEPTGIDYNDEENTDEAGQAGPVTQEADEE